MSIRATAVITKETLTDPRGEKTFHALFSLLSASGKEYGVRRLTGYQEVGNLLQREAGVTYEEVQDSSPLYEKGQQVRLFLTLEDENAIRHLGFDPRAAD